MITLILPYWDRQEAADAALSALEKCYIGLDLEVLVIDDGNVIPFKIPESKLNIRVITLPVKHEPTSPLHAWNVGVQEALGDVIAISCIEIMHEAPVLAQMRDQLELLGSDGYVLASAWCPEHLSWHCHSSVPVPDCPEGTGIGFLSMMHKSLYQRIGGFDEEYMHGAGYEDRDFIRKLVSANSKFFIRDDLVVIHPKTGASIEWKSEGFMRNEALFHRKWKSEQIRPVTFVCLKAGKYYSAEYVNILHDMIVRNLPGGFAYRFVCITDDAEGLNAGIGVMPLPDDLETWYGKLYMFKRGLFADGERCIFFDLDTVITGRLDDICKYQGQFATLRDFYDQHRVGPAVILWESGELSASIWDEWVNAGKPRNALGDLWWINNLDQGRFVKRIDILQDLFPGEFVSFKADCQVSPPATAAVVCFHGLPRPHQSGGWVDNFWKIGGYSSAEFDVVCNTELAKVVDNIRYSSNLDLPWLELKPETGRAIVLCGGGASLSGSLDDIKRKQANGALIVGLNGAAQWLVKNGIKPDWLVMIDSRPHNVKFTDGLPAIENFIASQCSPCVFNALDKVTLFHIDIPHIADYVQNNGKQIQAVGGGSTVGLIAMSLAYTQGFREMHLYGYDSSFKDGEGHAYEQKQDEDVIEAVVAGKTFKTAPWMVTQAIQFQSLANQLRAIDCSIFVHGNGMLPYLAWAMSIKQ